ncbi:2793_t:CDS:2 [Acaulospora morrowiae]|uniref:2793_t:CDS:1 n=1 Tax=Acaulospora morrowiae TaxID=94023 RepID=A0A9N8ZIE4_9GLOM|nr:2793_t:CDS:2 [Acaulospora morrowiae]
MLKSVYLLMSVEIEMTNIHNLGRNRIRFWDSIATRVNQEHNTTSFNGHQCKEKFMNLLMCDYMSGNRRARRSRTGAQYFNEFRTHFWERPEDDFDRIRNINSSNRKQRRIGGNNTPAPSTREVEQELGRTSPGNRRSRRTSVDSRRSLRRSASPPPPRDAINTNTNNSGVENPEQNTDHAGSVETSSLQPPPPYSRSEDAVTSGATDEAQNNVNRNSSHNVDYTGGNLDDLTDFTSTLNITASQNDSDVNMADIGGSQPSEPINE